MEILKAERLIYDGIEKAYEKQEELLYHKALGFKEAWDLLQKQIDELHEINRKEILRHLELDEKNIALWNVMEKAKILMFNCIIDKPSIDLKDAIQNAEQVYAKYQREHEEEEKKHE